MAASDLCDVESVKLYANIKSGQDDELLGRLVTAVSAFVSRHTGRTLIQSSVTKLFDGTGGDVIVLPEYPVRDVTAVSVNGQAVPEAVDPMGQGFHHDDLSVWLRGWWFERGRRNVSVTWSAGYATNELPEDLKQVVTELVALVHKDRDRIGLTSKGAEGQTTAYLQAAMPRRLDYMLRRYMRVVPT